jgi:hypothetical protein
MELSDSKSENLGKPEKPALPKHMIVKVDFYDDDQKELFKKNNYPLKVDSIVSEKVAINTNEFLTYLLFTEQKKAPGFRTFTDFRKRMPKSYELIRDYLEFDEEKMRTRFIGKEMDKNLTERIGVALSLCTLNKIHNLMEADWKLIPISSTEKTLDFYYVAVENNEFIMVESKGSTAENNQEKSTSISNQKRSIEEKKKAVEFNNKNRLSNYKALAYGIISVIDNRKDTLPQVWLVDPFAEPLEMEPRKFKLLARLYFYWRSLRAISPSSTLLHALINRIETLETIDNYVDLDGSILLDRKGKEMIIQPSSFSTKSVIGNNKIIGRVYPFDNNHLFFMGFPFNVSELLVNQNFKEIIDYKEEFTKMKSRMSVTCRIRSNKKKLYQLPDSIRCIFIDKKEEYVEFELKGDLYSLSSGRVFGLLDFY